LSKVENNMVDFSNIRDLQNLIKTNGISVLAMNMKSFKQRLSVVGGKIDEIKKNKEIEAKKSAEIEAKKVEVVKPVEEKKVVEVKASVPQQKRAQFNNHTQQNSNQDFRRNNGYQGGNYQNRNGNNYQGNGQNGQRFERNGSNNFRNGNNVNRNGYGNQNGGYQGGNYQNRNGNNYQGNGQNGGYQNRNLRFNPTGERRFDNNQNGGQGSYNGSFGRNQHQQGSNNGQFQRRPAGAAGTGFGPRLPKPTESFDASSLARNNRSMPQKKKNDYGKGGEEKKALNKKALIMRGYVDENGVESELNDQITVRRHNKRVKEEAPVQRIIQKIDHAVITTDNLTVKILAETIGKSVPELMSKFLLLGMMVNINSNIDYDSAELVASEFGITLERKVEKSFEEKLAENYKNVSDDEKDLVKRPAVVCVMGHVDHGKTSLLDRIRKTNVVSGEAGGITQSIGAYTINLNGEDITFIDTPGHEAFTAMRERGAKLTDIAILVVAADDGVMPQTVESIKQIRQANVPMIVAINKIDVPKANIENVKTQLATYDVLPEEWGGDAILVPISAKHGQNIDKLLEMVLFVAEYQNLKANPKRQASGSIIEAKLDKGVGAVATVLVQNGTLKVGDYVVVGTCTGKIRAMTNDKLEKIRSAGPSMPVQIMGLSGVPNAGDELFVVDEKMSRQVALERQNTAKVNMIKSADLSIENMMNKIADSNFKDFNVIVKADVQGSVEALKNSLLAVQNEEVKVRFVSGSAGAINENDVSLAQASNSLIIAFNTKTDFKAKVLADKYKVEIKNSKVIYEVLDYVTERINKMVTPKYKEIITGHAEIRATFKASKIGLIAGTYVTDGRISRGNKVRIFRNDEKIYEGEISTLQREKNEAKDVDAGFECGVTFKDFTNFVVGDTFETYNLERIN